MSRWKGTLLTLFLILFALPIILLPKTSQGLTGHYEDQGIAVDFTVSKFFTEDKNETNFKTGDTLKLQAAFKVLGEVKQGRKVHISWESVSHNAQLQNVPYKLQRHYYPGDPEPYAISTISERGITIEFLKNCDNYFDFTGEVSASATVVAEGNYTEDVTGELDFTISGHKVGQVTVDVPKYEKPGQGSQYQKSSWGLQDNKLVWALFVNDGNDKAKFDASLSDCLDEGHIIDKDSISVSIAPYCYAPGTGNTAPDPDTDKYRLYGKDDGCGYHYIGDLAKLEEDLGVRIVVDADLRGMKVCVPKEQISRGRTGYRYQIKYTTTITDPNIDDSTYRNSISGKDFNTGGQYIFQGNTTELHRDATVLVDSSMNAKPYGQFTIYKRDMDDHTLPIPGVTFKVWPEDEGITSPSAREFRTDDEGKAVIENLKPGRYCYGEFRGPANVILSDGIGRFTIKEGEQKSKSAIVYNKQRKKQNSKVHIEKVWHNSRNEEMDPPDNAEIKLAIFDGDDLLNILTLNKDTGWKYDKEYDFYANFRVEELRLEGWNTTIQRNHYVVDGADHFDFTVTNTSQIEHEDIKVCKKWEGWDDFTHPTKPNNLHFILSRKIDEGEFAQLTTEVLKVPVEDGCVVWKNLPLNDEQGHKYTYKVDEVKLVGSDYVAIDDNDIFESKQDVEYSESGVPSYTFTNTYIPLSSLRIIKQGKDPSNTDSVIGLAKAQFELRYKEGSDYIPVGNWRETDSQGQVEFSHLKDGKYKLTEKRAPAGYELIDPIYFEIKDVEGSKKIRVSDDGGITWRLKDGQEWVDFQDPSSRLFEFSVLDPLLPELPITGSSHAMQLIGVGLGLIGLSGVALSKNRFDSQ